MSYVFDPDVLHEIAKEAVGLPFDEMVRKVVTDLDAAYPGHIDTDPTWAFSIWGGSTGHIGLLHASLSEYVLIYGTPIGTMGFSGRYLLEIHDFVISGTMWTCTEECFGEGVVTGPGGGAFLPRGKAKACKFSENNWMLEYARGPIVTCLPYGLSEAIISAQDVPTVAKTVWAFGRCVVRELLRGKI